MRKKQQRIHHQIEFWPTSRLRQHWEVPWNSASGVPVGKRSQASRLLRGWDFKNWGSEFSLIIPGCRLISSSVYSKSSSGFMLMLFVLWCKTWNVVKPGTWLVRASPWAQQFQDLSPILSMVPQDFHSQQIVRAVSRQVRSKVRDLVCLVSEA